MDVNPIDMDNAHELTSLQDDEHTAHMSPTPQVNQPLTCAFILDSNLGSGQSEYAPPLDIPNLI
jgi:hypothetical protein